MAETIRFELGQPAPSTPTASSTPKTAPKTPAERPSPASKAAPQAHFAKSPDKPMATPAPVATKDAFSDLEIAFFEQDLQKVEEVDTFEDLVQGEPEPNGRWGRIFTRGKKEPEPDATSDKSKKLPRAPNKRK